MKVEIYSPATEIEAQRILSFLLSAGIPAVLETEGDLPQIPLGHQMTLFVPQEMRQKAIELIANARLDQIITDNGTFL